MLPLFAPTIDVIVMLVAIYLLERTKKKSTAKREVLLCDMQHVFSFLIFFAFLVMHIFLLRLVHVTRVHRMHTWRLTLWGDFVEVEGIHLHHHMYYENILMASRVDVRKTTN